MVARCMDGGASPMTMFVNVHLSGDDASKHGAKIVGKLIEVEISGDGRLNIPFAGAPLKVTGGVVAKVV